MLVCAGFLEMRKNMIRHDSFFKRLKRGGSLFLAVLLAVQSFFNVGFGIISADASEGENRGSTFAYYGSQNLLKEGASFPFYGKNHNRVGLWPVSYTHLRAHETSQDRGFRLRRVK